MSTSPSHTSSLAIQISDKKFTSQPLVISTVYIPPTAIISSQQFENFFNSLTNHWIVMGDFNAKSHTWINYTSNILGLNLVDALNYIPSVLLNHNTPTHVHGNALDLCFVSPNLSLHL